MYRVRLQFHGSRTLDTSSHKHTHAPRVFSRFGAKRVGHHRVYEAFVQGMGRAVWLVRGPSSVVGAAWTKSDAIALAIKFEQEDGNYFGSHRRYDVRNAVSVLPAGVLEVLTRQGV